MTWQATAQESIPVGRQQQTWFMFSNGVDKFGPLPFMNSGNVAELRSAFLSAVQARDNTGKLPVIAPGTVIDIVPDPVPADPTPGQIKAQQARQQFFDDLQAARQQAKFDALSQDLQARCLPEYINSL